MDCCCGAAFEWAFAARRRGRREGGPWGFGYPCLARMRCEMREGGGGGDARLTAIFGAIGDCSVVGTVRWHCVWAYFKIQDSSFLAWGGTLRGGYSCYVLWLVVMDDKPSLLFFLVR